MMTSGPQLLGLALVAVVMLGIFAIVLRRQPRKIWYFAIALLVVGLGYLSTTPAPTEIARIVFGQQY